MLHKNSYIYSYARFLSLPSSLIIKTKQDRISHLKSNRQSVKPDRDDATFVREKSNPNIHHSKKQTTTTPASISSGSGGKKVTADGTATAQAMSTQLLESYLTEDHSVMENDMITSGLVSSSINAKAPGKSGGKMKKLKLLIADADKKKARLEELREQGDKGKEL